MKANQFAYEYFYFYFSFFAGVEDICAANNMKKVS